MTEMNHADKSKKLLSTFQALFETAKKNYNHIMRTEEKTKILNRTFNHLCDSTMLNLRKTFNIWR